MQEGRADCPDCTRGSRIRKGQSHKGGTFTKKLWGARHYYPRIPPLSLTTTVSVGGGGCSHVAEEQKELGPWPVTDSSADKQKTNPSLVFHFQTAYAVEGLGWGELNVSLPTCFPPPPSFSAHLR